jgi:two-component system, cell cycle sensor histidine kinase and response regulator CckA
MVSSLADSSSSPSADSISVLVVDDDNQLLRTLRDILRHRGYAPLTAASGRDALEIAERSTPRPAVALVDLKLPDMEGTEVVRRLHALSELTETVILTGHASVDSAVQALRQQSSDYLVKPVSPEQLLSTIERAGERWQRRRAEEALRQSEESSRLLERELVQAQKMESIGRLAGGIAHDFNNLLTAILGFSEMLLEDTMPGTRARRDLEAIQKAASHGASLTRQLLAFSRRQVMELAVLDLGELVHGVAPILQRLLGEDVHTTIACDAHLKKVKVDRGQLEQVVMNLAVNARDAMPEGGKLTVEVRNVMLDADYVREHSYAQIGPHVMLGVSDTGVGMDAATRGRIFEPFFTTKEIGKGTGLGLSTVYGIIKQSGGSIEVFSELNKGTTFKVFLPVVDVQAESGSETGPMLPAPGGAEAILLVEDDPALRELLARTLTRHGYRLSEAATGLAALELIRDTRVPIDLLLTDAVLPGLSGPSLAREAANLRPGIRVLFVSGYTDDAMLRLGMLNENQAFLQKPFGATALLRKVRQQLDRAAS